MKISFLENLNYFSHQSPPWASIVQSDVRGRHLVSQLLIVWALNLGKLYENKQIYQCEMLSTLSQQKASASKNLLHCVLLLFYSWPIHSIINVSIIVAY